MRVLVSVNHPAHVHLFKNTIWELQARGHEVAISARKKEVTCDLLDAYDFPYTVVSEAGASRISLMAEQVQRIVHFIALCRDVKPDLCVSITDPSMAFASRMLGIPYICFTDTECARATIFGARPFADVVLTPSCFVRDLGRKQIRYDGYHELAYLHPDRFTPDASVLDEIGLGPSDPLIIIRLVSWQASHDAGQHGITDPVGLVEQLKEHGHVLVSSEGPLPTELEEYRIRLPPEKLHDLMCRATIYVGEGATTASECAMLGTPAIYVNTLRAGTITEQERRYELVHSFTGLHTADADVIRTAIRLLEDPAIRGRGERGWGQLMGEKIDLTAFMVWFIENYPRSVAEMKAHPEVQHRFLSSSRANSFTVSLSSFSFEVDHLLNGLFYLLHGGGHLLHGGVHLLYGGVHILFHLGVGRIG